MAIKSLCMLIVIVISSLSCTEQQVYYSIQSARQNDCQKQPPSQYDECMEKASTSYNDYQRKLEEGR